MRKGNSWLGLGLVLVAAPAIAARATDPRPNPGTESAKKAEERWVDLDEIRAELLARIAALLGRGDAAEARGDIVPNDPELTLVGASGDCARGDIVPACR